MSTAHEHPEAPGYSDDKKAVLARLRRIEGQVRGLTRMVEDDTYCIDVLTQARGGREGQGGLRRHRSARPLLNRPEPSRPRPERGPA